MSATSDKGKEARDTLYQIYSFYASNRDSLERIPSLISDSSGDIKIGVQIPSESQTEELKKHLKELLKIKETIDNISEKDKQMMIEAANASTIKRKKKNDNNK